MPIQFIILVSLSLFLIFTISFISIKHIFLSFNFKHYIKFPLISALLSLLIIFSFVYLSSILEIQLLKQISYFLFVSIFMLFFFLLCFEWLWYLFKIAKNNRSYLSILVCILYLTLWFYNAQNINIKTVSINSDVITRDYNIVFISDFHIGSNNPNKLNYIVERVNEINPELILIWWDLIDEKYIKQSDLSEMNNLNAPIYLIYWNHEYITEKTDNFFKQMKNINLINDKIITHEQLEIIWIDYYYWWLFWKDNYKNIWRKVYELWVNKNKFTILLSHEPVQANYISDIGIDLMLSGHVHNWQVFPLNFFVKLIYDYTYWLHLIKNMNLYVSSWVWTWWPSLRFGSENEIVNIVLRQSW